MLLNSGKAFLISASRVLRVAMPLFKVGDRVERIGVLAPTWMKEDIITKVIPNKYSLESATEYEMDFGQLKAILYQVELRLIKFAAPHD